MTTGDKKQCLREVNLNISVQKCVNKFCMFCFVWKHAIFFNQSDYFNEGFDPCYDHIFWYFINIYPGVPVCCVPFCILPHVDLQIRYASCGPHKYQMWSTCVIFLKLMNHQMTGITCVSCRHHKPCTCQVPDLIQVQQKTFWFFICIRCFDKTPEDTRSLHTVWTVSEPFWWGGRLALSVTEADNFYWDSLNQVKSFVFIIFANPIQIKRLEFFKRNSFDLKSSYVAKRQNYTRCG